MTLAKKSILIIITILIIDQVLKIWIKTTMPLGGVKPVFGDWFMLRFIENPGMAFGIDIPGKFGKLALSIFRILAFIAIGWYLHQLIKKKASLGLVICLSMILAGAIGNIIDSAFYGLLFGESTYTEVAKFLPEGGGYASFLHGQVVDMFYFPILKNNYPQWFPFVGGQSFVFFRPIFNIADSSITVGVITILIFQKRFFKESFNEQNS